MAAFLITSLSVTAVMGTVTMATSLANGIYTLSDHIIKSTDSGVANIQRLIAASDLRNKIKIMSLFIREIEINDETPHSIKQAISSIKDAISDIDKELKQIQYRIDYNDNMYFTAAGLRSYKFDNSYKRLEAKIMTLNNRYDTLKSLFSMRHLLNPNRIKKKDSEILDGLASDEKMLEAIMQCDGDVYNAIANEKDK